MNVTVSVFGRFHAFYLARELERRGHLRRLITSHPRRSTEHWGVSKEHVQSLWYLEALQQLVRRLPSSRLSQFIVPDRGLHRLYERLSAERIPEDTELFVGWSGTAEKGIEKVQAMGGYAIVERGSTHIRVQREILEEEYERHGVDADIPSWSVVEKEEREYEAADAIAVPSTFVEKSFREKGVPGDRLIRVPYGVDPAEFNPVDKEDDVFRVVYAGQMGFRKGVHYLLQAWEALDLPKSELLLLGPVRQEFKPWMERYRGSYRHPGALPQNDLYKWYSQGSVFVLPSIEEGMAMVQLQAMCCGLPLLCTPSTGGTDLIREGCEGFVVPAGEVEGLRARLVWCYENQDEIHEMGIAARRRILKDFTWRDYGQRIVKRYREARGGRRRG